MSSLKISSVSRIAIINTLNIPLSLLFQFLIARKFGVSRELEIYMAAIVFSSSLIKLTQSGQLTELIFPIYRNILTASGEKKAVEIFNVLLNWIIVIALGLYVLLLLNGNLLLDYFVSGFDPVSTQKVFYLFKIYFPFAILQLLSSFLLSYVNFHGRFGVLEMLSPLSSLLSIILLLVLPEINALYLLLINIILSALNFLCNFIYSVRVGFRYQFIFKTAVVKPIVIIKLYLSTVIYVISVQLMTFTLNSCLSQFPQGTYAIYYYIDTIFAKINGVIIRPISTVYYSQLNGAIMSGQKTLLIQLTEQAIKLCLFISVISFIGYILIGEELLVLFFGIKEISSSELYSASLISLFFVITLFVLSVNTISRKLSVSTESGNKLYIIWSFIHLISCGVIFFFSKWLGIIGICIHILNHNVLMSAVPLLYVFKRFKFGFKDIFDFKWVIVACIIYVIGSALYISQLGVAISQVINWTQFGAKSILLVIILWFAFVQYQKKITISNR